MAEKVYVKGSAKKIQFDNGSLMKVSFNINDFAKKGESFDSVKDVANEKGWVNILIKEKREVDDYGNTHYIELDTWKPDPSKGSSSSNSHSSSSITSKGSVDDLPF